MAIAEDRRRLTTRLNMLRIAIGVAFGLLACGFWFFQVVQHAKFKEMAENNHQRTLTLRAPRGVIFDRTGRLLVENRNSFNISIVREHTKDLNRTMRVLSTVTGFDEKAIREIVERHRREPSYRPIVVISDATLAQVALPEMRRLNYSGRLSTATLAVGGGRGFEFRRHRVVPAIEVAEEGDHGGEFDDFAIVPMPAQLGAGLHQRFGVGAVGLHHLAHGFGRHLVFFGFAGVDAQKVFHWCLLGGK